MMLLPSVYSSIPSYKSRGVQAQKRSVLFMSNPQQLSSDKMDSAYYFFCICLCFRALENQYGTTSSVSTGMEGSLPQLSLPLHSHAAPSHTPRQHVAYNELTYFFSC